jgi:hypothetical protein
MALLPLDDDEVDRRRETRTRRVSAVGGGGRGLGGEELEVDLHSPPHRIRSVRTSVAVRPHQRRPAPRPDSPRHPAAYLSRARHLAIAKSMLRPCIALAPINGPS